MQFLVLIGMIALLTGCAVGGGEFSCKGYQEHTICMDVEQIYQATHGKAEQLSEPVEQADSQSQKIRIWLAPWHTPEGKQVSASLVDAELSSTKQDLLAHNQAIDNQYFNPIGEQ